MSIYLTGEQATDFLTVPVSGIDGLGALVYNEAQQRYEVPGVGAVDILDMGVGTAKGIARNVLQGYCSTADISQISDAEITQMAVEVVKNMAAAEILQIADSTSAAYKTYANELGKKVCSLATSRKGTSSMPIPWGWIVFATLSVVGGYFLFRE